MEISGEHLIAAPRERVWEALNDAEALQASIPGCEVLDKESDTQFSALIVSRFGSIKARFSGRVSLSDIDAPNSYRISGQGQGGVAGMAKGSARVSLEDRGESTLLRYVADAEVAGKLASVGSRVIHGVLRKTAEDFFANFARQVAGPTLQADSIAPEPSARSAGLPLWWAAVGLACAALVAGALYLF